MEDKYIVMKKPMCIVKDGITYLTEAGATSFGNYLLSDERKSMLRNPESVGNQVTHADVENWEHKVDQEC